MIVVDEKVDEIKIQSKQISDFQGWYKNKAEYKSKSSLGVTIEDELLNYIHPEACKAGTEYVNIFLKNDQHIRFTGIGEKEITFTHTIKKNENFTFEDGIIIFSDFKSGMGSPGSPGFGVGYDKYSWIIDENNNLVVTSKGSAVGVILIVPVIAGGKAMVTFQRVTEKNQIGQLNYFFKKKKY
jgi:hypothetical protein